jgi:hypothetical protein
MRLPAAFAVASIAICATVLAGSTTPEIVTSLVPGEGVAARKQDDIWSGRQPATPPFAPGYESVYIPWQYTAASDESGPFHVFAHLTLACELENDRSTITASKGSATIKLSVSSPNYC